MARVASLLKAVSDLGAMNLSTVESGENIMVLFPKDISSIILMVIDKITESRT